MRKVYLLITAALLLCSSSLWAATVATVDGEEFETIDAAITEWSKLGKTKLTLLADCEYDAGNSYCDLYGTKTLDLNDKTLTWKSTRNVCIYSNNDGVLNIVDNSGSYNGKLIFDTNNYGLCTYDGNATINISNCIVSVSGTGDLIYQQSGTVNVDNSELVSSGSSFVVKKGICNVKNGSKITTNGDNYNAFSVLGSGEDVADYSVLSIGDDVTVSAPNGNGICIFGYNYDTRPDCYNAYGVVLNLEGKLYAKRHGISTNGNIRGTGVNVPKINIASTSEIKNLSDEEWIDESTKCGNKVIKGMYCGIYAAGYAEWNIKGNITASTPIYSKSGTIRVDGAKIHAIGNYYEPLAYGNGACTTGDAIIMDSHESYPGNIILQVVGNSEIVSDNGYAVQEALTYMPTSKSIELTLENSSFAGAKGTVTLSDDFRKALVDGMSEQGDWKLNGVTSGKYTAKPEVVKDGYEVVELSGELPFLYGVVKKTATSYITNYFEDKAEFLTFTVARGNEYVVRTGHTVNIGTLNIGDDASYPARVRIQPKGTLVVGDVIINNNKGAESLIVESDVTGYGMLLFNSNTETKPFGTVEMYSHARILNAENGQYLFQHFGLPVYSEGAYITKNVPAAYSAWDIKKGWGYVSSDVVLNNGPWIGSNETPNSLYAGSMFSFSGVLVGNSDAEYNISSSEYGYKCFANSYSAPMSMTKLMEQYNNPAVTDGTVWVFKASDYEKRGKEFVQWVYADAAEENAAIDPLQAFFVLHQSSTDDSSFTVNYKNAVYDFNKGLNGDVKGAEAVTIDNKGKITITDGNSTATLNLYESQDLSDDFDMNYDGYQMETGNIQIYVSLGGKKWSSFGSNSFDGKEITIVSKEASQITMSFSKLAGKAFKLIDMASGAEVEVGSDNTYTFTVEPNATAVRFKLGEGEVSANEADANDAVNIWSNNGRIFVANNIAEDDIEIINLSGVKVVSAKASGEAVQAVSISNLASGVYVVRVGNTAAKIVK